MYKIGGTGVVYCAFGDVKGGAKPDRVIVISNDGCTFITVNSIYIVYIVPIYIVYFISLM
jgi:hypothetical protein